MFIGKGIKHQRFIRAACRCFGRSTENAIEEKRGEEDSGIAERHKCQQGHFYHHETCRCDQERSATELIGDGATRYFKPDNGDGPDEIQNTDLRYGQPVVEKQDAKNRIVKACVEKNAKQDETTDVVIGEGRARLDHDSVTTLEYSLRMSHRSHAFDVKQTPEIFHHPLHIGVFGIAQHRHTIRVKQENTAGNGLREFR